MDYKDLDDMLSVLNYNSKKAETYSDIIKRLSGDGYEEKRKFILRVILKPVDKDEDFHAKPIYLLLQKLVKDGWIDEYTRNSDKSGKLSDTGYSINYDGIEFIKFGGYNEKFKINSLQEKQINKRNQLYDFAQVSTVLVGAYYAIQILKESFPFFVHFLHSH